MSDFLRDPNFPDRPQHPDFWRLSSIVTKHDGKAAEGGESTDQIIAAYIDPASLLYMIGNRAAFMAQRSGVPQTAIMAAMLDAVLIGIAFEKEGGHRDA